MRRRLLALTAGAATALAVDRIWPGLIPWRVHLIVTVTRAELPA